MAPQLGAVSSDTRNIEILHHIVRQPNCAHLLNLHGLQLFILINNVHTLF